MARIVLGSYLVRYPLGGMMSWVLQYLVGFARLGHDVYFVERANWPLACFDPATGAMTDDPMSGTKAVSDLLGRFGLANRWCFVDYAGCYHGMSAHDVHDVLNHTDVFIDMGVHGSWSEDAQPAGRSVLIDGEPGFTQMKMVQRAGTPQELPAYDFYFTTGRNIGMPSSTAPAAGKEWRPIFHPVVVDLFAAEPPSQNLPVTTVMNWQSYDALVFDGTVYGHKDVEFEKFLDLPRRCSVPLEIAVAGHDVPLARLTEHGWRTTDAHQVSASFDTFRDYIRGSSAEFSVCKGGYVATHSGWFSDRAAAYLASGRPVVQQDTGFGEHLPTGQGLHAVADADEAAAAIAAIHDDLSGHSKAAREIAGDCLDASVVLPEFLREVGL
jgi:hypothetical protein